MQKNKPIYESPDMTEIRVELENSICSGSVDITATSPGGASTSAQTENSAFGADNDFASSSWDTQVNQ